MFRQATKTKQTFKLQLLTQKQNRWSDIWKKWNLSTYETITRKSRIFKIEQNNLERNIRKHNEN